MGKSNFLRGQRLSGKSLAKNGTEASKLTQFLNVMIAFNAENWQTISAEFGF